MIAAGPGGICALYHCKMNGLSSESSSSSGSASDAESSQPSEYQSDSQSDSESTKSDAEKTEQAQQRPHLGQMNPASGGAGAAACPEEDAPVESVEKSTKKRNRNPAKWELLQEWDAAQYESDQIQQELLAIVIDINVAAGLDKFPVHKDRTGGLHVLTYDTSWTTKKGLITEDLCHFPLQGWRE